MVEQFNNLKGTKQAADVQQQATRSVEITAPILDYQPGMVVQPLQFTSSVQRSCSPEKDKPQQPEQSSWKSNPMFASNEGETLDEEEEDEDDEDVPEIIKRLSQNGLPTGKQLSDTLSSDMIVNSISNGNWTCLPDLWCCACLPDLWCCASLPDLWCCASLPDLWCCASLPDLWCCASLPDLWCCASLPDLWCCASLPDLWCCVSPYLFVACLTCGAVPACLTCGAVSAWCCASLLPA